MIHGHIYRCLNFCLIFHSVQAEIGRLDPYSSNGKTGTLGRLADVLSSTYNVNAFAVDTSLVALEGAGEETPKTAVNSEIGFQKFNPSALENDVINAELQWINGGQNENSNFFRVFSYWKVINQVW